MLPSLCASGVLCLLRPLLLLLLLLPSPAYGRRLSPVALAIKGYKSPKTNAISCLLLQRAYCWACVSGRSLTRFSIAARFVFIILSRAHSGNRGLGFLGSAIPTALHLCSQDPRLVSHPLT